MKLEPVDRVSLSHQVFAQLRDLILSGEVAAEETLPPERALASTLGVNRSAVREALKRLEQVGLVRIQHGGKTRVRDLRSGGLQLLPALLQHQPKRREDVVALRAILLPEIARTAAERADSAAIARLEMLVDLLGPGDPAQRADLAASFWDVVVDASDNLAYRFAYNAIRDVLPAPDPDPETYAELANALAAGDTRGAALTTSHLVHR